MPKPDDPDDYPPYLRMPVGYEDEDNPSTSSTQSGSSVKKGRILSIIPLSIFFGLVLAISVGVLVSLACVSDVMAELMGFAANIPAGESVNAWLQAQFIACTMSRAPTAEFLFPGAMISGVATLTVFVWYHPEIGFSDLI